MNSLIKSIALSLGLLAACGQPEAGLTTPASPAPETGSGQEAETTPMENETVIVMLGDSLTAGYGLAAEEALPEQVEARLQASGVPVSIINAGVSGDTTANGLARFDWSVTSADPDILLVALGANDFLQGQPPATLKRNLSAIIERAQAADIEVILVGLSPRSDDVSEGSAGSYASIYPELAEAYGIALFPDMLAGVWDTPDLLQADGLHPTADGIDKVAERLAAFLASSTGVQTPQP